MREAMAMIVVVLLPIITTTYIKDFYDSIFRGNLSQSDRNELPRICGRHYMSNTLTPMLSRSLGGVLVKQNEYPWVLALTDPSRTRICSAVLISRRHVLTAAHCVTIQNMAMQGNSKCPYTVTQESWLHIYPRTRVTDVWNIKKLTSSYRVEKVSVHPSFNPCGLDNDLALLEIYPNMFTEASPICMPKWNETIPKNITSAGFGRNPNFEGRLPMQVLKLQYHSDGNGSIVTFTKGMRVDSGDSGGPLFKENGKGYVLLGITSSSEELADRNEPLASWFEDIRPKLGWICEKSGVCPQ